MSLRRQKTVGEKNDMRRWIWAAVILAVIASGCGVSEKRISADLNNVTQAFNNQAEEYADNDFDLLEEEITEQMVEVEDPLEDWNRMMYGFNDTLYFWLLKPVTKVYKDITPQPVRIGLFNFFRNLGAPARFVNCRLQGKTATADMELKRFLINTTAGVLGFGDPAKDRYGLKPPEAENLCQTLATYGLAEGFYIVWPLFGPSTVRDSAGIVGGLFLNPVFYIEPAAAAAGISTVKFTNENSFRIGEYEAFKAAAIDPYVAMRRAYIQYRNRQIRE
ncbi:MAG: MlaA family lipoprotein [Planctomycetota bacterium]|jgi:phospholipid-binding lipoprotein MlaA